MHPSAHPDIARMRARRGDARIKPTKLKQQQWPKKEYATSTHASHRVHHHVNICVGKRTWTKYERAVERWHRTTARKVNALHAARSSKAGLQFPVGRVHRHLRQGRYAARIGGGGMLVWLVATRCMHAHLCFHHTAHALAPGPQVLTTHQTAPVYLAAVLEYMCLSYFDPVEYDMLIGEC